MRTRRGSILVLCFLLMAFVMTLGATLLMHSLQEQNVAQRSMRLSSAFQLAEAGLDDGARWLRAQPSPPSGINPFDPFGGPQNFAGGTYTVTIDPDDNNPTSYLDAYALTVTGVPTSDPVVSPTLTAVLQTQSFSQYAYFTSLERSTSGSPIWFTSNDHLEGPIHSNDQFNIAGSPVFDGPVSSAAETINYKSPPPTGGNHPQFNRGLALGAPSTQTPTSATQLRVAASGGGQWYSGNTTIVFQTQTAGCAPLPAPCELVTNPVLHWVSRPQPLPSNGAIFVNGGNATVSGTVDGQVTVGTSNDLRVAGNVLCADDPQISSSSNDVIGLLAEGNVVVASTAPYDLAVQASIMALNESFSVENWWVGPPKGTLSVYGGMIQKRRGAVGTFSSTTGQKLSGYSKHYQYDTRLSSLAPPYYPTTGRYQEVLWRERN